MPYLLHEDPMALPAPTNHTRKKCEKTQINNSFESILDEVVNCSQKYYRRRNNEYVQSVRNVFLYILYIQIGVSEKA